MEFTAKLSNARMTPRKMRALRGVVIGLPVGEARAQLSWQGGKAAGIVGKVMASAVANAEHNHEIEQDNLVVKDLKVDEGMRFKRWRPASRGMAHAFTKQACHVTVILEEIMVSKGDKKSPKAKQADIETLTVDELARREKVLSSEPEKESGTDHSRAREVEQKIIMQQQGGDKKKTHRRKSI